MNWFRTQLFRIVFYAGSVPIVTSVPITALFGRKPMIGHAKTWFRWHRFCTRWIMGIRVRVEGSWPDTPVLFACKHQAMFETIELTLRLGGPAIILKEELTRIPFWGYATLVYGRISVDREASAKMLRRMMTEGAALKEEGRSLLIFPEGTRVPPGEQPPLKSGFAGLYKALKLPVVPVACDSGLVWPRHGPKRPGVITFRFGEVVPPGLPREEVEARVHAAINALER
jgi:1-acyl-sn-glycerol-3-phosphate acyltransferase